MRLTPLKPSLRELNSDRRPGGAQGAPELTEDDFPVGTRFACWLTSGDVVNLEAGGDPTPGDDAPAIPWSLVQWFVVL